MRVLMQRGQGSGFRMNGSGSLPRRGVIAVAIHGAMPGMRQWFLLPTELVWQRVRGRLILIRTQRVLLGWRTLLAMSGSGRMNTATSTHERRFCAAEVITDPWAQCGIFPRRTTFTSMENT